MKNFSEYAHLLLIENLLFHAKLRVSEFSKLAISEKYYLLSKSLTLYTYQNPWYENGKYRAKNQIDMFYLRSTVIGERMNL